MKTFKIIGSVSFLFLAGCASNTTQQVDTRECVQNFSKQGFKNYRTTVTLKGVTQDLAIKRLVRELGRKGFSVKDNNATKGYVNASFDGGLQLSAFVEKSGSSSRAELNYKSTSGELSSLLVPESAFLNELCIFAEAMR